jgi:hypothetical protein
VSKRISICSVDQAAERSRHLTAFFGVFLASIVLVASVRGDELTKKSTLKVKTVCIERLAGYQYSVSRVVDFTLVHAARAKREVFTLYVGNNPELKGSNVRYLARDFVDSSKIQYVQLEEPQAGQILGVPRSVNSEYFHLMVDSSEVQYSKIVDSVRFCSRKLSR